MVRQALSLVALMGALTATSWAQPVERLDEGVELGPLDFVHQTLWRGETGAVHLITRPEPMRIPVEANVTVIEQAERLILVDAGGSLEAGRQILEEVRALSDKPISHIIVTHWHGDHHFGLGAFQAVYPDLEVIAHYRTAEYMVGPQSEYRSGQSDSWVGTEESLTTLMEEEDFHPDVIAQYQRLIVDAPYLQEAYRDIPVVAASQTFEDHMRLDDGEVPVEVRYLGRANTDGDAVIWLPEQRIVATGDIVVAPSPFGFGSYYADWPNTLMAIKDLGFETLIPGHGPVQTDTVYIERLAAMMRDILTQIRTIVRDNEGQDLSQDEILEQVDWTRWRSEFAQNDPWLMTRFDNWFAAPAGRFSLMAARFEEVRQGE